MAAVFGGARRRGASRSRHPDQWARARQNLRGCGPPRRGTGRARLCRSQDRAIAARGARGEARGSPRQTGQRGGGAMSAPASSAANSEGSSAVQAAKTAEKRQPMSKSELGGVIVLDFGGQYTQLIARRIREQQVFSAILPCTASLAEIRAYQPVGIVLSGSPCSVYDPTAPVCDAGVLSLGVPVLGICYGLQWISHTLGGKVERAEAREYGPAEVDLRDGSALFAGLPRRLKIWMSHGDHVRTLPPGFQVTGVTGSGLSAAEDPARRIFAVQFHPEVRHTERGSEILRNFVFHVCGARPNWSGASFISETVEPIRRQVGRGRALRALTGGGGSAVGAARRRRAAGNRLSHAFVGAASLRQNEFQDTLDLLENRA